MLNTLLVSLGLTLLLEGLYGLIWRLRTGRDWLLLAAVNVVTNPIVVVLYSCVSGHWAFVAVLEAAGLNPQVRGEALTLEEMVRLSEQF